MAKQLSLSILAAALLASCTGVTRTADADDAAKLSLELAGKVAGKPQSCIRLDEAHSAQVYNDAIVYRTGRRLTYVNAAPGCSAWSSDPIFINEVWGGSQLCRGDIVRQVDRTGSIPGPTCVLGDFTPYRAPPKAG